jgi:hypothetical protein
LVSVAKVSVISDFVIGFLELPLDLAIFTPFF